MWLRVLGVDVFFGMAVYLLWLVLVVALLGLTLLVMLVYIDWSTLSVLTRRMSVGSGLSMIAFLLIWLLLVTLMTRMFGLMAVMLR